MRLQRGPVLTTRGAELWTNWLTSNKKRDEEDFQFAQTGESRLFFGDCSMGKSRALWSLTRMRQLIT